MLVGLGGGEGKGAWLAGLIAFLGIRNVSTMSLQTIEHERFALAGLVGKLANICDDLPGDRIQSSSKFKSITGKGTLSAEHKFGKHFDLLPYVRLVFSTNSLPETADTSDAWFDRWWVLEFLNKKRGTAGEIPRSKLDPMLAQPTELSGVLNHALKALPDVLKHGITSTPSMVEAHRKFRAATDPLLVWLEQYTAQDPGFKELPSVMLEAYNTWAARNKRRELTAWKFGHDLRKHVPSMDFQPVWVDIMEDKVPQKKQLWYYIGIKLEEKNF